MRRRGFTLIELLVVIAIIAILAAILFPVFARAREKARQTTCVSNLKQISLGLIMYCTDYDGTFPNGWGLPPTATAVTTPADCRTPVNPLRYMYWSNAIQPYIKNFQLFTCPSARNWEYYATAADPVVYITYPMNGLLANFHDSGIVAPSHCIAVSEINGDISLKSYGFMNPAYTGGAWPYVLGSTTSTVYWFPMTDLPHVGFHNGGDNKAYCDGHAKWTKEPGNWDTSIWASTDPNGVPGYLWWDGQCEWLFRPGADF